MTGHINSLLENWTTSRIEEFMSLLLLIYVSNKRSTSGYLIFPKIIVIICHIPLFMLPQATCMSLIKEKTRLTEVAKSSEALDFRPMNGTDLTPTPSHASKDTYYWNRPRPEELLLSLSQGRTNPNLPQRFIKTNSTKLLKETRPDEKRSRRRKKYNYRPYLWTPLRTKNCCEFDDGKSSPYTKFCVSHFYQFSSSTQCKWNILPTPMIDKL